MRYPLLRTGADVVDWARRLVVELERADAVRGRILRPAVASNAVTLDLAEADTFIVTLIDNLSTITALLPRVTNETLFRWRLVLLQDDTGNRTVAWPAAWLWPGGTAPTVTASAGAMDIFDFLTIDSVHSGHVFGQDMQVAS